MQFDKQREELKQYIDEDVRSHYVDERKLNRYQLDEKLIYITNNLWREFQEIVSPTRKIIQNIESKVLLNRFELDEALKKHCATKKDLKRVKLEVTQMDDSLDDYHKSKKEIETEYNGNDSKGDLKRFPMWVFILLMTIAGLAEVTVYFNVFLSQEIGLMGDTDSDMDRLIYRGMALFMATGFTVMLIWLSHKLGMMLRQVGSIHASQVKSYWIKFVVIMLIVISAIVSTVFIRAQMHEVMYVEHQIEKLSDVVEELSFDKVDDEEMDMDMDMNLIGEDEKTSTSSVLTENQLREKINKMKGGAAYLFIVINLFIVVSGMFLSYEVHTSSIRYEALEGMIERLKKKRVKLLAQQKLLSQQLNSKEIKDLMPILTKYVESVNTFDENSQIVKSLTITIENVYVELSLYMFGAMQEHELLDDIEDESLSSYDSDSLRKRFKDEWKLENVDVEVEEVMHINNIEEFIKTFNCSSDKGEHHA